jgi:hypothetical protein
MTPNDIATILTRLGRIEAKLDSQGDALTEIRQEVKKTNGRVTALEALEQVDRALIDEREHLKKARQDQLSRWIAPIVVIVAAATLVALLNLDRL